ncbi:MAG: TonB-dependent receptor [Melioribacteraceae bacterium]|nr:TonB-dependent receptor [Melioribacteraceae bacterium]
MLTNKSKHLLYIFIAIFLFSFLTTSYCGTTGKLAGVVSDKSTNELLIGVNIMIVGTMMGAASDLDGNYFIINVPPGLYEIKASLIGYASIIIKNVRISVDQTTKIDFEFVEESVKIGEVVVTAEKLMVRKDLTSTEAKVSGDQIALLPLEDVQSVVNLQAGVMDGHFRGGRKNEVKYLIDGVSVNDAFSGTSTLEAEVSTIEEVQVLTGTFNAEYGEALSGVVNQITKIAGDKFYGSVSLYSGDYVSSRTNVYTNINSISPVDIKNIQGSFSGPVPGLEKLLKFNISGRYLADNGYLYGQRQFNPSDSSDFSANDPNDWHIGATGDNKFVPMNISEKYILQGKLAIKVGSGRGIVLNALYQNKDYKDYNHNFKLNPDGDYKKFQKSFLLSASYSHVLSNAAFIDFIGSRFETKTNQYAFENPLDSRYVSPDRLRDSGNNAFLTGGTENWQFNHNTQTYTGKSDLTWQINHIHQIKTGVEFNYHNMEYEDFQIVIEPSTGNVPTLPTPGSFNFNTYKANPYQIAAYIQDKIELDYLIVNLGVRFDYFEPDGKYLKDPNNIAVLDSMLPPFPDSLMEKATSKYQFSPRLGISYPITDAGAIHISYGHFFQVPPFEYLYRNPNFRIPLSGNFPANIGSTLGNTDLEPQQTIMYEIGLQQALTPELGITLTGYYKDIRNLLSTEIYIKNNFKKFSKLINQDYGSVKGVTFTIEKRFTHYFSANLDYTYQVAKGNASDPNDAFNNASANPPIEANKQLVPLDWDRTHSLNFVFTSGIPGNFIASFISQLGTGLPYTPSLQNQRTGLENSDKRPTYFNVDIYLIKYFKLFAKQLSVYLKVYNLLDTANEQEVFGDTGRAGYTLELTRSQEKPRGVNTIGEYYTRPDFYSAPRQIIFGASFAF